MEEIAANFSGRQCCGRPISGTIGRKCFQCFLIAAKLRLCRLAGKKNIIMNLNLHLHESILLLSLDDEKGSFSMSGTYIHYGFAAALLMDLILAERIVVEDGRVKIKDRAITDNRLLNDVLSRLKGFKKNRKVAYCIHYLVQRVRKLRPHAIEQLIRLKILTRREEKVLWVFKVNRYPSVNTEPEDTLRERLHRVIFQDAEPTPRERMLLSIILACQLLKDLLPDKQERKAAKEKIKALTKDSEMHKLIGQAVLEMQAAVILAASGTT